MVSPLLHWKGVLIMWNKVCVMIVSANGHKTPLHFIVNADIHIGDAVICHTRKGIKEGTVVSLVQADVHHTETNCQVDKAKSQKEQNSMKMNELFPVAVVENRRGYKTLCKMLIPLPVDTEVVYEGDDECKHVGVIRKTFPVCAEINKKNMQIGGFVVTLVEDTGINEAKRKEEQYRDLQVELESRKRVFEQRSIYELLAEKDPRAHEILDSMDNLKSSY